MRASARRSARSPGSSPELTQEDTTVGLIGDQPLDVPALASPRVFLTATREIICPPPLNIRQVELVVSELGRVKRHRLPHLLAECNPLGPIQPTVAVDEPSVVVGGGVSE